MRAGGKQAAKLRLDIGPGPVYYAHAGQVTEGGEEEYPSRCQEFHGSLRSQQPGNRTDIRTPAVEF